MVVAESVYESALEYLRQEVAPQAQRIDRDPEALRTALRGMCDRGYMALKCPEVYGGPELAEPLFRSFQEEVARTSGSLAFLQTQHQSAVGMMASGDNETLKAEYLPQMGDGRKLVGIGFSQLRRPGPPLVSATPVDGGYIIHGHVPWVTGWNFYPEFLVGAALPDERSVFAIVPLINGPGVSVSPPMELAAMGSAMTVTVDLDQLFVPDSRVAFIKPPGWIQNNDRINIVLQGHFAIGCALAGLDILKRNADKRGTLFLRGAVRQLSDELDRLREETANAPTGQSELDLDARLNLRARQIELAVRCAHAAVISSSGAANSLDHPAQRVYREALVYTVSAQTTAVMEATLALTTRF